MAAIVTAYKETDDPEAEKLLGELGRWADSAAGVSFSRDASVADVTFTGDTETVGARTMVEDVLRATRADWSTHIGL